MKILQLVTKRQYRGAEVFAANLSKELIGFGHTIIFAGIYKNDENILEVEGAINLDLSKKKDGKFNINLLKRLVELIKETNPDVIQCNGSDTLKYMVAANYFLDRKPLVYRNISTISQWLDSSFKLSLYRKIFKKVDHVTSVGSESIEDLIRTLNYPEEKTSVIRRGIPTEKVDVNFNTTKLKSQLGIPSQAKIVMHVGNFSPEKNHIFLVETFQEIRKKDNLVKLICVGDGVTYRFIEEEVKKRNLGDTIFLLGFRKEIPELLAASDFIVLSSLVEGVPGVILEAAVQNKPAIASNVGGVKEVLIDGKTGYIIDEFKIELFVDKILNLCNNDSLRKIMGDNAERLVIDEFNPEKNAKKFETLYTRLSEKRTISSLGKDKKLKILQIIQKKQYRGAEIFSCQLSSQLEKSGHEVEIYSIYEGKANLSYSKPIKSLKRKENYRYIDFQGWKAIAEIVKNFQPDIIQANASDTLKYTVFSKKIFGWEVPIIFRNASVISYYINSRISKELNRMLLKNVDKIVSVSESSRKDLNEVYPFTTLKSRVITNGIGPREEQQFKNPFNEKCINIVHVGSLTPEKNHFELLKIFSEFLKIKPNAHLHIIGEGRLFEKVQSKIKVERLDQVVTMYGEKLQPDAYISFADMLVLPSLIEGLPGVILEAMYLSTPVIAYDVGGISEILTDETGYLIPKNNIKSFVEAMCNVYDSQDSSKIENAKKIVDGDFCIKNLSDSFLQVYYETIDEHKF
ncbi:hypothetical protein C7S20_17430 [Christiangramia fulva]|uniref:Glycosyltransferase n=1 Tax=Christiangramia fulva TaxID=2126553 RepID=A0A2R3Z9E9_9FLAO|nr:glycosyltransferase [Christiangramia fulva]AVR46899.1 hypothetical protein C7S20_17430 [Christiangramia fulva]